MRIRRDIKPIGIVDIGSNSIRMCVFDAASRVPVPLFNEKAVCGLGQGIEASGRLNPDGVGQALLVVARFVALSRAMGLERLDILATAAVRDAADGAAFAAEIQSRTGAAVQVLSGADEATLAAQGVLCGCPEADGIVCDLGGGSLELIAVEDGAVGEHVTMPLGLLRLAEASHDDRALARAIVDRHLDRLGWLAGGRDRTVYAVGGAWRALARVCMAQTQRALSVLDNFSLDVREALRIIDLVAAQSRKSLEKMSNVPRKRALGLPLAALVLERVLRRIAPRRVVFSVYGMREGQFFRALPDKLRREDPLLATCRGLAQVGSRFPEHGDELMAWTAPLFPREDSQQSRIRHAACLVSDAFWNDHPDYRAEQAFLRILRLPFIGVGHPARAEIALTVYIRYLGDEENPLVSRAALLLDDAALIRCRITGSALRLAHKLSGGAPNLLRLTRLSVDGADLVLDVPAGNAAFVVDPSGYDRLVRALGCERLLIRRL